MGKILKGLWDSPMTQFNTLTGRDLRKKDAKARRLAPFKTLEDGGRNMSAKQKKEYLAREKAKGSAFDNEGKSIVTTKTPLTDRYS
jgi:hypothetical protein